jgi:hypothetical protein
MTTEVVRRSGKVTVGPPDGPTMRIPAAFTIQVTGETPYDLRLLVRWDPDLGRHTLHQLTLTEQAGGEYVRMSQIKELALADLIERTLVDDVVGPGGWSTIIEDHPDIDPVALDALVYRLAFALGGQKPAATVALARGLSPATGPKRAQAARQAGLIPPAEPGKASG